MKKRTVLLLFALALLLTLLPAAALANGGDELPDIPSGNPAQKCGDDLCWSFDPSTGALAITGSGAMEDYASRDEQPWTSVRNQITSLSLLEGVLGIGTHAFAGCSSLTDVTFPASLSVINTAAFMDCTGIDTLVLPNTLTAVDTDAFSGCTGLQDLTLPGSITLNDHPFSGCANLSKVTYTSKNGTLVSPRSVFDNTGANGVNVVIGQGIQTIPSRGFNNCSGIKTVFLPDGVISIENFAFDGCTALTSINIPESVIDIGMNVFNNTAFWNNQSDGLIYLDNVLLGYKNTCPLSITVNPGTRMIAGCAFRDRAALASITFPDDLRIIGDYAFYGCTGLTSIVIPDSVSYIGDIAFYGSTGLTSVTVPCSVRFGTIPFSKCTNISEIRFTKGTECWTTDSTNELFFDNRTNELTVTLDDGIKSIGDYAFYDFTGLLNISIPDSVTSIGKMAFYRCTGLTSVIIPERVTSIGDSAFSGCTELSSITIPCSITSMGTRPFAGCTNISNIHVTNGTGNWMIGNTPWQDSQRDRIIIDLDEGLTNIGNGAFFECVGLMNINIPDSVTSIGKSAFSGCSGLLSITIPDTVSTIGSYAFSGCTGIIEISIPNSITEINDGTFSDCTCLRSINIPSTIKRIGEYSFNNCSVLKDVYYQGTEWQTYTLPIGRWGNEPLENATWHYLPLRSISMESLPSKLVYAHGEPFDPTGGDVKLECENGSIGGIDLSIDMVSGYDASTIGKQVLTVTYAEKSTTFEITVEHTPGTIVRENEVFASCLSGGSYDEVLYCTFCGEELSRVKQIVSGANGHAHGAPIAENAIEATCTQNGGYDEVVYCSVCGEELSREAVVVEATGHVPGEPVRKNEVKATTTTRGHYDEVVYCTVCGEELSREEKAINKSVKGLTITGEPEDAKVKNGEKATFTVKISGKATAIQWYYRTSETAKWKKVSSKGNKLTLTVTGKPGNDGYQYRCELKNGKKKLYSDTVTLDVELFPPTISSQPESVAIKAGEEATFTFVVEGEGVTYAWSYRKGETGKWATVKGGTGATLTVTGTAANAGYQYKCEAKNKDGKVTSDIVTLDVEYHLPEIVTPPKGVKVKKNAKVTFNVEADNPYDEELTFQWYYRKSSKAKWVKIKGATEAAYSFKATAKKNGYQYKCDITNRDGTVSTKAVTLKVK